MINLIFIRFYIQIYALTSVGRGEKADVTCATVDLRKYHLNLSFNPFLSMLFFII